MNNQGGGGSSKTQHVQQQVDEVVGIMQDNIHKVRREGPSLYMLRYMRLVHSCYEDITT